ncbi:MAG: LysR family transcriptional regulator [Clostridia bacterium]|nr:LysR family transcriptional regulator [Clostridia bacterium]
MNTLHLKYALEVARTRSISQAAANLFMAQPNLSKAIRELEEYVGIKIFERSSRGVVPTEQGLEFLGYAQRVLADIDKMKRLRDFTNIHQTNISIPRGSYISKAFADFIAGLDMSKEININLRETNSKETILNVSENDYNIGIIRYQIVNETYFLDYLKEKGLDYRPLWRFKCVVVMSREHRLAKKKKITYEELVSDSVEIVHGDNVIPYTTRTAPTPSENIKRRIYVYERGSQFELLSNVKNLYMWVSPVPDQTLESFGLVQKECDVPDNEFIDLVIFRKGYKMTELELNFLKHLERQRNIVESFFGKGE